MTMFKDAFDGRYDELEEKLEIDGGLLTKLKDAKILTKHQLRRIKHTEPDKIECLLTMLEKRPDADFEPFCEALKDTNQEHIINDHLNEVKPNNQNAPGKSAGRLGKRLRSDQTSSVELNEKRQRIKNCSGVSSCSSGNHVSSSGYGTMSYASQTQHRDLVPVESRMSSCSSSCDPLFSDPDSSTPQLTTGDHAASLLATAFGERASFHKHQKEAIVRLVDQRPRMLLVQAAGWGKTFVYVAAAMLIRQKSRKVTLVASPLLALMRNHVDLATQYGAEVACLSSEEDEDDQKRIRQRIINGEVDIVLTTPEKLSGKLFVDDDSNLLECVGLLVVDEAQCIAQWGSDFRPDFRRLAGIVQRLPGDAAVLAITATATDTTSEEICSLLQMEKEECIRGELQLPNVQLRVVKLTMKGGEGLAWLVENIGNQTLAGFGIIFCLTKAMTKTIARLLRANKIDAREYYDGVLPPSDIKDDKEFSNDSNAYRQYLERRFLDGKLKVIVATSALGMGFDKSDVGFVVLYQLPLSLATCYQQFGRAGRQIKNALGIIIHDHDVQDSRLQKYMIKCTLYRRDNLDGLFKALSSNESGLSIGDLEMKCNMPTDKIETTLKFLTTSKCPPVKCITVDGKPVKWQKICEPDYESYEKAMQRITETKQKDWELAKTFCKLKVVKGKKQCMMQQLCKDLGGFQTPEYTCGKCDLCKGKSSMKAAISHEDKTKVIEQMKSTSDMPLVLKKKAPASAFVQYRFPSDLLMDGVKEGRTMCQLYEPGWGETIVNEIRNLEISSSIVNAAVELIMKRWTPTPNFGWVTCIPSATKATMVSEFARSLADGLGKPFYPVIMISKQMEAKRKQQNAFHRCRNLDGGYSIDKEQMMSIGIRIREQPVLLVDYLVQSRWTLTVAAKLLNQAGSGPVFPFALAKKGSDDTD